VLRREGIYAAVHLAELTVSLLPGHGVTVDAVVEVFDMVTAHNDVCKVELILIGNVFAADDALQLGHRLRLAAGSRLGGCSFHSCSIDDGSLMALVRSLCENTALTSLTIMEGNLQDAGAAQVASFLRDNATLQLVDLISNNIGDKGAASLAESLRHNSTVRLNLGNNNISDACKAELGARLPGRMTF